MFFKTKRNRRKTTRQTLHTEQLEPKAMFSVSPVEPVVALDVGPVNQTNVEDCMVIEPVFNVGEDGRMIIHPQFNVGEDGRMIIHPQFNVGEDGRSIVHPQYNLTGSCQSQILAVTTSGGDDVFMPKPNRAGSSDPGGDVFMPKPNRIGGTAGPGGTSFMTGVNSLAQANQQPNVTNVWTNGNATSMAPRHAAFARMGR